MTRERVESLLNQEMGLDPQSIGPQAIERAIRIRIERTGLPSLERYMQLLQSSQYERDELIEAVTVSETWFFRDTNAFRFLGEYVVKLRSKGLLPNPLVVLSAPCSTGEEPYSIAMTLMDCGLTNTDFVIDAIDISRLSLGKAQEGVYRDNAFRSGDHACRVRYFSQTEFGYVVHPSVKQPVSFQQGNILRLDTIARYQVYHVIFCRNLMIYLDETSRYRMLDNIARFLHPDGALFLGSVEIPPLEQKRFKRVGGPSTFAYEIDRKLEMSPNPATRISRTITRSSTERRLEPETKRKPQTSTKSPNWKERFKMRKRHVPAFVTSEDLLKTAMFMADRGQLDEALDLCTRLLNEKTVDARIYFLMGEIHQAGRRENDAESCFRKALDINPNHYEALVYLALLHESRGDAVGAETLKCRARLINESQEVER